MPWRVGRDLRQLSQAANVLFERTRSFHPPCLLVKPLHATRGALWPPAVAVKYSYSHAPQTEGLNGSTPLEDVKHVHVQEKSLQSVLRRDLSVENVDGREVGLPVSLPPELLSLLDTVFAENPSHLTLSHMRRSQTASKLLSYLRQPHHAPALVLHLLDAGKYDRAIRILHLSAEVGYTFSPKFYGACAERLAHLGRWQAVVHLVNWARERLGYTTTWLLNWRLQALTELQQYVSSDDALALFEKERVRVSRLTYHLLIAMHMRNHHLTAAFDALRRMERAGFAPTSRTWAVVLLGYRSFGITPTIKADALAAINAEADDEASRAILNALVRLLLDAEDMSGVAEVLSFASRLPVGLIADTGEGSTRRDGATVGSSAQKGTSHMSRSNSTRDLVDVTTYNLLLSHLARRGDLTRATYVLEQMQAATVSPDSGTAAALIRLYYAAGYSNDALHVAAVVLSNHPTARDQLSAFGFSPCTAPQHPVPAPTPFTVQVLNALLYGVLNSHGMHSLRPMLSIMGITGVGLDPATLTLVLRHARRYGRVAYRTTVRIIRRLMSLGVAPSTQHLHVLLGTLVREDRERSRVRGWRNRSPPNPRPISESTKQPIVDQTADSASSTNTSEYFRPDAGLTFPLRRRRASLLRPILQSLHDRRVRSDPVTFAMRIKHDGLVKGDMEAATHAFRVMVESGIQPTRFHFGALMEGHAAAGDMRAATEVMHAAAEAGARPDVRTHTILIAGYARLGKPALALGAFRAMVAAGIRPDVPAIDALVSAFYRARAYAVARRVLLRLWPQVAPLPDTLVQAPLRELAVAFRALHNHNRPSISSGGPLVSTPTPTSAKLSPREQHELRRQVFGILKAWRTALGRDGRVLGAAMDDGDRRRQAGARRTGSDRTVTLSSTHKLNPNDAGVC